MQKKLISGISANVTQYDVTKANLILKKCKNLQLGTNTCNKIETKARSK